MIGDGRESKHQRDAFELHARARLPDGVELGKGGRGRLGLERIEVALHLRVELPDLEAVRNPALPNVVPNAPRKRLLY